MYFPLKKEEKSGNQARIMNNVIIMLKTINRLLFFKENIILQLEVTVATTAIYEQLILNKKNIIRKMRDGNAI